jgi:hypothetical protein
MGVVPLDCPPNPGGIPVYLHSHDSGLWGRIRRDRLTWIGTAAIVPSAPDLSSAPTIATSSVARDVTLISMADISELRGHVLTLLAIIDGTGGFMSPVNQEAIREARKAVKACQ